MFPGERKSGLLTASIGRDSAVGEGTADTVGDGGSGVRGLPLKVPFVVEELGLEVVWSKLLHGASLRERSFKNQHRGLILSECAKCVRNALFEKMGRLAKRSPLTGFFSVGSLSVGHAASQI